MKITQLLVAAAVFFGLSGVTILLSQDNLADASAQLSEPQALQLIRLINTAEREVSNETHTFVPLAQLLRHPSLEEHRKFIALTESHSGRVKDRKLSVLASADGKHYTVALVPESGCEPAVFSNEAGLIYRGKAFGCPAE